MADDQVSRLSEEIDRLSARVAELERLLREHVGAPRPEELRAPPPPAAPEARPQPAPPPPIAPPPAQPAPSARPAESRLEAEFGGNWLNKIGAIALVLGMAFFLKYAIENRWIDETGRIIIGLAIGLACVYGGEYFQKRNLPLYAQGISGAGVAILYFTIYAAFAFYQLVPQAPAFAFMFVVTITAIAISVRHDAIAIAILGIIGAFLTPVLLQNSGIDGGDSGIQLFTYIAVLDLGILGITRYKGWRSLNILSLIGTALIFQGWAWENYSPDKLGVTMLFLTIFFAIFAAQSFVQNVIARRSLNTADIFMAIVTPILYFTASYSLLADAYRIYLGVFSAVMAALYLALAHNVRIIQFEDRRVRLIFLGVATAFLTLAIPIQLRGHWITIGWSVEAAVLAAIGFNLNSVRTREVALLLLVLVLWRLLFRDAPAEVRLPFLNDRFTTFLVAIAISALIAWMYGRYRESLAPRESKVPAALVLGSNFLMIWALSLEAIEWVWLAQPSAPWSAVSLVLSAVWLVYGTLMLAGGIILGYRPVRIMALILICLVILKSFLIDVWWLQRLHRIIAFISLGVVLFAASYIYQARRRRMRV